MIRSRSVFFPDPLKMLARRLLSAALVSIALSVGIYAQQVSNAPLENMSVIKLVKAGFREKTIIAIIGSRPNHFKLETEHLIELKRNGVSENIILAMLSSTGSFFGTEDDWSDESFFRGSKKAAGGDPADTQSSGMDIFGSGGSSQSRSRSRGTQQGNDSDGSVTGSATVRIIRPPTEAGGAPPKLEKTPTLNNDAVVRLVDAGFSEGTIIKRIEESTADFDLSPAGLEELRKRRVTDPIISAMTTAMGDKDPDKPLKEEKEK